MNNSGSKSIDELSYVEFISLLKESNRPPGGKHTVRYWITNAHIGAETRVLEIGSNTGFTSLELCRSTRCEVVGVDISPDAVEVARSELAQDVDGVRQRVQFHSADVRDLPFDNDSFDAVVCGGALSFVQDRGLALSEIKRVLRPWGFLCVSPLCYRSTPPSELLTDLKRILGFDVPQMEGVDWLRLITSAGFEVYATRALALSARKEEDVLQYVDMLMKKYVGCLDDAERDLIRKRARYTYLAFNENHKYLQAMLGVFRKRFLPEENELFGVEDWL